jgi:hypothetical protein
VTRAGLVGVLLLGIIVPFLVMLWIESMHVMPNGQSSAVWFAIFVGGGAAAGYAKGIGALRGAAIGPFGVWILVPRERN